MPIVTQEISNNIHTAPENPCCAPIPRLHLITPQSQQASRGFAPRSLDSGSRVLAVTPRGHPRQLSWDAVTTFLPEDM